MSTSDLRTLHVLAAQSCEQLGKRLQQLSAQTSKTVRSVGAEQLLAELSNLQTYLTSVSSLQVTALEGPELHVFKVSIFPALQDLEVFGCPASCIQDLYCLRTQLKRLKMSFGAIPYLNRVLGPQGLDLSAQQPLVTRKHKRHVCDIDPSLKWTNLTNLILSNCAIDGIDESAHLLPSVRSLDLSNNQIPAICHLQDCYALERLNISFNRIQNLKRIYRAVGNIRYLSIAANKISSTEGLERLFSLVFLDLSNNLISNYMEVSRLTRMPCLENLLLVSNPLTEREGYRVQVFGLFMRGQRGDLGPPMLDGEAPSKSEMKSLQALDYKPSIDIEGRTMSHDVRGLFVYEYSRDTATRMASTSDEARSVAAFPIEGAKETLEVYENQFVRAVQETAPLISKVAFALISPERIRRRKAQLVEIEEGVDEDLLLPPRITLQTHQVPVSFSTVPAPTSFFVETENVASNPGEGTPINELQRSPSASHLNSNRRARVKSKIIELQKTLESLVIDSEPEFPLPSEQKFGERASTSFVDPPGLALDVDSATMRMGSGSPRSSAPLTQFSPVLTNPEKSFGHTELADEVPEKTRSSDICSMSESEESDSRSSSFIGSFSGQKGPKEENASDRFTPGGSFSGSSQTWLSLARIPSPETKYPERVDATRTSPEPLPSEVITDEEQGFLGHFIETQRHRNGHRNEAGAREYEEGCYTGDPEYAQLFVAEHLELYFQEQVLPVRARGGDRTPFLSAAAGVQYNPNTTPETFVQLVRERMCPIIPRNAVNLPRPVEQPVLLVFTDVQVYIILDDFRKGVRFCDSPRPRVLRQHALLLLYRVILSFGFQRLTLEFEEEGAPPRSSVLDGQTSPKSPGPIRGAAYTIITRDKPRTYRIISSLPPMVNEIRGRAYPPRCKISMENWDQQLLDEVSKLIPSMSDIVHYQLLFEWWKSRPNETSARSLIMTNEYILLCNEDFCLPFVKLQLVEKVHVREVLKIRPEDNPLHLTFILKPTSVFGSKRRWRLAVAQRSAIEKLISEARKLCPDAS